MSECILWTGARQTDGYGSRKVNGKTWLAHRWAWTVKNGPIPKGLIVCHSCDNPPCCNPDHLSLGTDADNKRDSVAKGRHRWPVFLGEHHPAAALTAEQVRMIRSDKRSQRLIAAAYGISQSHVSDIRAGKKWSHL